MVLIRPLAMVLAVAACDQSLFDARGPRTDGGPGDGGGDADVPTTCPAGSCLADAAADFDGSPGGIGDRWRYFEDKRDRTWARMTITADDAVIGAEPGNALRKCAGSSPACQALPGALLVSSSGLGADPALQYTSPDAAVIQLALRVRVPSGADQTVRLYRNSREDVLFTATAAAGATVAHAIEVDALPGDRFLLALQPGEAPGVAAAVHFFVIDARRAFPSTCQLAASFAVAAGVVVDDLCTTRDLTSKVDGGPDVEPVLLGSGGPFAEQGDYLRLLPGQYLRAPDEPKLARSGGPVTIQFWVRLDDTSAGLTRYALSDADYDINGGGSSVAFFRSGLEVKLQLDADGEQGAPVTPAFKDISYPDGGAWHFLRLVDAPGRLTLCIDGALATTMDVANDRADSSQPLYLGKLAEYQSTTAVFDGALDDVRVFSGALPCN